MAGETQGELIERWRKRRGMIQRDVAEVMDISQSTISAWERNRWQVPKSKRGALCHATGGNTEELKAAIGRTEFEEDDPADNGTVDSDISASAGTTVLELKQELDRFRSINDELTGYLERIAKLEPVLQRLEKTSS